MVNINHDNFFEIRSCTVTRGHPYKIFKHHCTSSTRSSFFSERVVDIWSGLSSHHTDFSSLLRFKRCINSMDFSDYLQFVWLQILFRILICVYCLVLRSSLISGQLSVLLPCCPALLFMLLHFFFIGLLSKCMMMIMMNMLDLFCTSATWLDLWAFTCYRPMSDVELLPYTNWITATRN